jgi:uncharacterized protein YaaN involved in tellurite resistance
MEEEFSHDFKKRVKVAFSKVKNDISSIKADLEEIKQLLKEKNNSSTGNEGVYSFIHSFNRQAVMQSNSQIPSISSNLDKIFSSLTKQELMVLLSLFQLEEEKGPVSYTQLSDLLKLSEGCIRTYTSSIIKKGIPLKKERFNNKITLLSVDSTLRNLNLKQKLVSLYYHNDPNQSRLTDI